MFYMIKLVQIMQMIVYLLKESENGELGENEKRKKW